MAILERDDSGATWIIAPRTEAILRPVVAKSGRLIAAGDVRLDNADEVASWSGTTTHDATDLELLLRAIECRGAECVPDLLGDFAFIVCDLASRELIAARDAFGVRTLFYARRRALMAISSRASLLAECEEYDEEYIAEYLINGIAPESRAVFKGVNTVPPASIMKVQPSVASTHRYWRPADYPPREMVDTEGAIEMFRDLFIRAVRLRLGHAGETWAQLSGGLDSSSVVSTACRLAGADAVPAVITGTVTLVDTLGAGDERPFSDAVVRRYGVPNHQIVDYWLWQDDGMIPPLTDQPELSYPFYARDRRMRETVRAHGGRVLLSGVGGDHYLTGNLHFFADWISKGQIIRACREMARWTALGRTSFWKFAFENSVLPLLPESVRRNLRRGGEMVPGWIDRRFARRLEIEHRQQWRRLAGARRGDAFASTVRFEVEHMWACLDRGVVDDAVEMRYPFLYRPLVEFCLALPAGLRTRPFARKWIMREAMRGTLPEEVRTRRGKGGISGRIEWSLAREREQIDALLRDPILAQLGCVLPSKVEAAIRAACAGDGWARSQVMSALALETWLSVRAQRWPNRSRASPPCRAGSPAP